MTRWLIPILALTLLTFGAPADDPPTAGKKAEENAKAVAKTLRAHIIPAPGAGWDEFQLRIVDRIGESEYATAAGWEQWADGKETPYVEVTTGYLRVFGNNPDALAVLLARELGSLVLGHAPRKGGAVRVGGSCANRRREADADLFAVELLLKSGYSLRAAVEGLKRDLDKLPVGARFALAAYIARLARLLDPGEELWRIMPALDTGLMFLAAGKYSLAAVCFARVAAEFPQRREAWACLAGAHFLRYRAYFAKTDPPRKQLGVTLADGKTVTPDDELDETLTKLGKPTRSTPACPGTTLKRLWLEPHGLEVFTDGDEVLFVVLKAKGPQVNVLGADGKPAGALKVGMARKQVEALPGGADSALSPFLPSGTSMCAYYPAWGVAVVYDRDGPDSVVVSVIVGAN